MISRTLASSAPGWRCRRKGGLQETDKRLLQPRKIVLVSLHVVGVDVGHHRGHRLQVKKGGVGFVGLRRR